MVKKLQALKAKKGFTLVELIVVIAIIGVLAAILVPTMMGMVTKSRVTSADQTASSLVTTITTWMSDLESNKGTIPSGEVFISITGHATTDASGNNTWSGSVSAPGFKAANDTPVATSASADTSNYAKARAKLESTLANDYNFTSDMSALIIVSGRKVVGCAYSDTGATLISGSGASATPVYTAAMFRAQANAWDGKTDGIDTNGNIIGTSPKLLRDNVT